MMHTYTHMCAQAYVHKCTHTVFNSHLSGNLS